MSLFLLLVILTGSAQLKLSVSSSNQTDEWKRVSIPCSEPEYDPADDFATLLHKNIENKTQIELRNYDPDEKYELNSNLCITEVIGLRIIGYHNATINCPDSATGISFVDVTNLHLESLSILHCGLNITGSDTITIQKLTIQSSPKSGLVLIDFGGTVLVQDCIFLENGHYFEIHGDGLERRHVNSTHNDFHERGGGMQVQYRGGMVDTNLMIQRCKFFNNFALHGGGLFMILQDNVNRNNVTIDSTIFENNTCLSGGGALQIGFVQNPMLSLNGMTNNSITIHNCTITANSAKCGGGTAIFSTLGSHSFAQNTLKFSHCHWTKNSAILGLAVDIAIAPWETFSMHRHLPTPVFSDCSFVKNRDFSVISGSFILNKPRSTLVVTGFIVDFQGTTEFRHNLGSAIEAASATLDFKANSSALFIDNRSIQGGAMQLVSMTVMFVRKNSYFLFKNNKATYSGGAIFVQFSNKHSLFSSRSCYLQYAGGPEPQNVTLIFRNNFAGYRNSDKRPLRHLGDSFFVTSLAPCLERCIKYLTLEPVRAEQVLRCVGNVTLDGVSSERRQISTSGNHFALINTIPSEDTMCTLTVINDTTVKRNPNFDPQRRNPLENQQLYFVPGKVTTIPLRLVDDVCADIFFLVRVHVWTRKPNMISVDPAHSVITDNRIALFGNQNSTGFVQLTTIGIRSITVTLNVTLNECPPGYVHVNGACVCSSDVTDRHYKGIERCKDSVFRAYVLHGFWVGYVQTNNASCTREWALATAVCPKGFCSNSTDQATEHLLPPHVNDDISRYICNENRTGIICGTCRENHSAYYHSTSFSCRPNNLCYLGWLFYILSELLPVAIFFLVVILLNISFTSGPLNGVIFFMQVVDTLKIKAENFIWFKESVNIASQVHRLIYHLFTLNFFNIDQLSFCLWSGASALDMLAFKYITIIFSLFLVILTILLLKVCNIQIRGKSLVTLKGSMIHGLSAFLVVNYFECTRVSLMIITRSTLNLGPRTQSPLYRYVAFYNGEYEYMSGEHLRYALPACFFIATMVFVPPVLLLGYPLCYKVFSLLRIEESKCVQFTCKVFPLEKIKPLFDSIQGAFKDRYRFFAGLYFIYRLCALSAFAFSRSLTEHYTVSGILLVCMLAIHAMCRPYKKTWHNILDALLFLILCILNAMTFYNFHISSQYKNRQYYVFISTALQTGFIMLPLLYLILYAGYCVFAKFKKCLCVNLKAKERDDSNDILQILDTRSLIDSEGSHCEQQGAADYVLLPQQSAAQAQKEDHQVQEAEKL